MRRPRVIYAANHLSDSVREGSSSGGAFYSLALAVLKQGGAVIGAAYNGTDVVHILVDRFDELDKLRKSKYAPSSLRRLIKDKAWLKYNNKPVLFSGTPCQVKAFRTQNRSLTNFYYVEIACHGVPTLESYKKFIEENNIVSIDFRCKRNGWREEEIEMVKSDGSTVFEKLGDNAYYKAYQNGYNISKACYDCHAKYFTSGADFTLADFWGVEAFAKSLDDDKGTSLVLIHSKRGECLWNQVSKDFVTQQIKLIEAILWNPCIVRAIGSKPIWIERWHDYKMSTLQRLYSIYKMVIE